MPDATSSAGPGRLGAGPIALGAPRALGRMREGAAAFLEYVQGFLPLATAASEAAWAASTDVSDAHTADQIPAQALNEFVGAPRVIEGVRAPDARGGPRRLAVRQLEKVRLRAAEAPGTIPEVVKARTEAEARQSATQDGFVYTLERPGKPAEHPSANASTAP